MKFFWIVKHLIDEEFHTVFVEVDKTLSIIGKLKFISVRFDLFTR